MLHTLLFGLAVITLPHLKVMCFFPLTPLLQCEFSCGHTALKLVELHVGTKSQFAPMFEGCLGGWELWA